MITVFVFAIGAIASETEILQNPFAPCKLHIDSMAMKSESNQISWAGSARVGKQGNAAVAELSVSDLSASANYYVGALGFEWIRQSPTSLELALGGTRLTLKQASQPAFERSSITLFCADAAFLHDRLRTRGVRLKGQMSSKPFGVPNFCALDLDGNELLFCHHPKDASSSPLLGAAMAQDIVSYNYPFDRSTIRQTAARSYEALEEYSIFDSLVPAAFHSLTELAAMSFHCDRSMITLIDRDRQWFASHYGCSRSELPLDCSICVHVATARIPIVIRDAKRDRKWQNHPAITDDFRFYAGVPLFSRQRVPIGAMCIVDRKPKRFTATNMQALGSLAVIANCMLEKMRLYARIEKCCP
jgi:hypothetical protein